MNNYKFNINLTIGEMHEIIIQANTEAEAIELYEQNDEIEFNEKTRIYHIVDHAFIDSVEEIK